jgi:ribosomal protein L32
MKKKSKWKKRIRISETNLEWIRQNKDTRTMAGYLDKIINNHKKLKI